MSQPRFLPSRSVLLVPCAALGLAIACSNEPVGIQREPSEGSARLSAKSPTALAVTSTNPSFGDQATTIDVHIIGTGFTSGAQATWLLNGVGDPAHVRTNSTTFVSSTELIANITIASDAQLAFWDVQVSLSSGKNGVGSEAFEVTSAQVLGSGTPGGDVTVFGMNEQLQVVGSATGSSNSVAWVYDDALGMVNLGSGSASGIDPLGTLVVGRNANGFSTAWVRQTNDTWLPEALPTLFGSVAGTAAAATRTADGTLLVVGWSESAGRGKSTPNPSQPVAWRRGADGAWSAPVVYAMPSGATVAMASDVNPLEQVVAKLDNNASGAVWENPTTFTVLDAVPTRINRAGTLIAGGRNNGSAVYWYRDPVTHAWNTTGVPLPSLAGAACTSGLARDVNDAGVIVGWSCTSSGDKVPTVWRLDFSGAVPVLAAGPTRLPGLGVKSTAFGTAAANVTETAPYVASGTAMTSSNLRLAVRWNLRW